MPNSSLMFLHALTSLHPGAGTALGTVDLPVQRERHTGWPVIPGSSLKGVLRDTCREKLAKDWLAIFGPESSNAGEHAGALAVTDARILAFPVRSLKGVFAWVTCRAVLHRFLRDARLQGQSVDFAIPAVAPNQIALGNPSELVVGNPAKVVLEEFEFTKTADATGVAAKLAPLVSEDPETQDMLKKHLAVLHDDDFTHFVRNATEVVARIGLEHATKTVKSGALFYQEMLPPETLLCAMLLAEDSRMAGHKLRADKVRESVQAAIPSVLQIGGDETLGKGLCSIRLQ